MVVNTISPRNRFKAVTGPYRQSLLQWHNMLTANAPVTLRRVVLEIYQALNVISLISGCLCILCQAFLVNPELQPEAVIVQKQTACVR